ncbi:MAG: bile acid:sodium symporter [Pirellulaceae bacterium]
MKQFLAKRWFLIALVATLLLGAWLYEPLTPIASLKPLRYSIVAIVLFLMALPLETQAIVGSMKRPKAVLLPVAINFGLLPLFAFLVSQFLNRPMAEGLLVAAVTPCTLASASVWTRRAGGNDTIAILVTVVTNLSCFIISPLWLFALLGESVDLQIDFKDMVIKLAGLVVLPMTLAQLVRIHRPLGSWATKRKNTLSSLAQCGILFMVFTGAVGIGRRIFSGQEEALLGSDVALMIVAVLTVHIVMFWTGIGLGRSIRLSREDTIAVGFSGSQKTLMVGLQICMDAGVLILPMVTYHIGQLFVDTLFADYFAGQKVEPPDPAE